MKTWLLLSRLGHGGLERVQLNIAKAMHLQGIDVSIVAGQVLADVSQELPSALPVVELAKAGPKSFPAALARELLRSKPDVVFTTSNDVACLLLILRLLLFRNVRVIVTEHLSLSAPRRKARGFKRAKLELIRVAMRLLLPHAEKLVAVSEGVAQDLKREVPLREAEILVIHNPIVTADFDMRMGEAIAWPWPDKDIPTVIFVGRLSQEKRLDLLLDGFRSLIKTTPARLLLVGTGPLQTQIENRIQKDDLASCCKLTGFIENPLPLIAGSDLLVLPSDYEGFGNVLVEAMACGIQVVATDCPYGPAEILDDGQFGQLVPTGDPSALQEAIRRSLLGEFHVNPSELRARAGVFAVDRATDRYVALVHHKTEN